MKRHPLRTLLFGNPLVGETENPQAVSLPKWKALAVFASDAISSTAYATEEILLVLAAVGGASFYWSLPIALSILALLWILTFSYRKVIRLYPEGGGAYRIVKENLGVRPSLLAAGALLMEYALVVSVSIAACAAALGSAMPWVAHHTIASSLVILLFVTWVELRGGKEGAFFSILPTYLYIFSMLALLGAGVHEILNGRVHPIAMPEGEKIAAAVSIPMLLVLRAFSSGCVALTGMESISSRVASFKTPSTKNAKKTLTVTGILLGTIFIGITFLARYHGVEPEAEQTVISSLARIIFNNRPLYYFVQASTAAILAASAGGAFRHFPILASQLAKDRYLPRQLASVGDRLVFSNAVLGLAAFAGFLIWSFDGKVHGLIPLYAVGVFLTFTLSQASIVKRVWKDPKIPASQRWFGAGFFGVLGTFTSAGVLFVIAASKFAHGAWVVFVILGLWLWLFSGIHRHYCQTEAELSLEDCKAPFDLNRKRRHRVVIPVGALNRGVMEAVRYAILLSEDVRACYVEIDPKLTENMKAQWNAFAPEVPLVVLKSPYRSVITPLIEYLDDLENATSCELITIVIPEAINARWYQNVLHNQTAFLIRAALIFSRNKVVTSFRYHLKA